VIISCNVFEFEPSGENFVELEAEPEPFTVNWEDTSDTLAVWGNINMSYELGVSDVPIISVGLLVNNIVVSEAPAGQLIWFNSRDHADGLYPMQLVALGNTGTGSLMDKLGIEYQLIPSSAKYIHIDNAPVGKVEISNFTLNKDRTLTIEWEPYDRPRYGGYSVRDITYCEGYIPTCSGGGYVPAGTTSWTDESYDGHDREYLILVHDVGGNSNPSIGNPSKFTSGIPSTQFTDISEINPNKIQLNWSPAEYTKSFLSYSLDLHSSHGDTLHLVTFRDINQTQFEYEFPLATKGYVVLSTVSDHYPDRYKLNADSIFVENGRSFTPHNHVTNLVRYLPHFNHYLVLQEDNLMLLDANSLNLIKQESVFSGSNVHFRMSNDLKSFIMVQGPQVKIFSAENLDVLHDFHIGSHYSGLFNIQLTNPIIDDRNQLWVNMGESTGTKILNLNTMQKIDYQIPNGPDHFISAVHPNDNLILGSFPSISGSGTMNQYRYHLNDQVELIRNYDPYYNYDPYHRKEADFSRDGNVVFITDRYNKVIGSDVYNNTEVVNYDLPWTLVETFHLDVNQNIFYYRSLDNSRFEIRSLDDGRMLYQFPIVQFRKLMDIHFEHEIVWFQNGMYQFLTELN